MCSRFVISDTEPDLVALFDVEHVGAMIPAPNRDVRPTDLIPVVIDSAKTGAVVRRLEAARWSLVPSFATELKLPYPTHNARSEDVASKPAFRDSLAQRRALIPTAGYYEWKTTGGDKKPFFVHQPEEEPMAFAGLYSWWRDPAKADDDPSRWVLSATILTAAAEGSLAELHDRVPVVLDMDSWDQWLDPTVNADQAFVDAAVGASRLVAAELGFEPVESTVGATR